MCEENIIKYTEELKEVRKLRKQKMAVTVLDEKRQ